MTPYNTACVWKCLAFGMLEIKHKDHIAHITVPITTIMSLLQLGHPVGVCGGTTEVHTRHLVLQEEST